MAIITATFTPSIGVKSKSDVLTVLSTSSEYDTAKINHPNVIWFILSCSKRSIIWDVYLDVESWRVINVTEYATPKIVAHPRQ